MLDAILFAHEAIKELVAFQEKIVAEIGKPKRDFPLNVTGEDITAAVREYAYDKAKWSFDTFDRADGIERIIINFCNPWNEKAKHHKRRLTHTRQLMQYRGFLAPGGEIYFKTDDAPLFEATRRYLALCGFEIEYRTDDLHASGFSPNYISEHEALYAGRGMPIHFLIARMAALPENFDSTIDGRCIDRVARSEKQRDRSGRRREDAQ